MKNNYTVSSEEKKIARKGFLRKSITLFAGLSLLPGLTKAAEKNRTQTKIESSGGDKKILSVNPFIGEIQMVAFNFAPVGWELCNGQLLSISQYQALFSLLGTAYGGNGSTTFGLPDLRGRVPIHQGQGSGLSFYTMGQNGGSENIMLTSAQIPSHSHSLPVNSGVGTTDTPAGMYIAKNSEGVKQFAATSNATAQSTNPAGSGAAHSNIQPYCVINYIIATTGYYPSRQ